MTLTGYVDITNGYNKVIANGESGNIDFTKAVTVPIGSVMKWCKTFSTADSGTTDGTTASKLVDSSQNFVTTVNKTMIIKNTTDTTWTYCTAVDSDTVLSLNNDIFISGENYTIYTTPALPDGWVECDGSVLSDSDSPFNGDTIPDLNGGTYRMLRGSSTSGGTGGADTHTLITSEMPAHTHVYVGPSGSETVDNGGATAVETTTGGTSGSTGGDGSHNNIPAYYEVVMIMRVK